MCAFHARIKKRRAEVVAPYGHERTSTVGADDSVRPKLPKAASWPRANDCGVRFADDESMRDVREAVPYGCR